MLIVEFHPMNGQLLDPSVVIDLSTYSLRRSAQSMHLHSVSAISCMGKHFVDVLPLLKLNILLKLFVSSLMAEFNFLFFTYCCACLELRSTVLCSDLKAVDPVH